MTWTYSGDPASSDLDQTRFLIGDTDTTDQLVNNEEVNWALSQFSVFVAAAELCDAIAAKFSRKVDKAVGDLKISFSKMSEQYAKKGKQLRNRGSFVGVSAYVGGISVSEKESVESNTDRVSPSFTRGMNDHDAISNPDDLRGTCR
jgi:hypothetical protein